MPTKRTNIRARKERKNLACDLHESLGFFFAEFLEARIVAQRIEQWIEPEQRGSERHVFSECASAGNRERAVVT